MVKVLLTAMILTVLDGFILSIFNFVVVQASGPFPDTVYKLAAVFEHTKQVISLCKCERVTLSRVISTSTNDVRFSTTVSSFGILFGVSAFPPDFNMKES